MAALSTRCRHALRLEGIALIAMIFAAGPSARADDGGTAASAAATDASASAAGKPSTSTSAPAALASAPLPGADLDDCLSCHRPLLDGRKSHLPIKSSSCLYCHKPAEAGVAGKCTSPKASAWALVAEEPALCATCHDTTHSESHAQPKVEESGQPHSPSKVFGSGAWHPVIKTKGCTACHDPHASSNHSLTKSWPVDALCAKCHTKYDDAAFIHTAVKKGECLGCHSPHGSDVKPLLLAPRDQLCASCHKQSDLITGPVAHTPVVQGRCLSCHDPHEGDSKDQLVETGKKLCLTCHDSKAKPGVATASAAFQLDLSRKYVHKPVANGNCQDCHVSGHSGQLENLLQKPVAETCFKCHTKFSELYKVQHTPARNGECAACHDPHSSDNKGLLKASINTLCASCHNKDVQITGRVWVHQPITAKGCTACHDAHGGDYANDLSDGEGNALCATCHKSVGANVKVNHEVLEKAGCIACHDPHAADQPYGLKQATNTLCASCHAAQGDPSHALAAGKVSNLVRTPGTDPASCTSCHDPHGSDNAHLLYSHPDSKKKAAR